MANKTVKDAKTIHGTNPQYLIEKIIRTRIYESRYWKEECFGLTGEFNFFFPMKIILIEYVLRIQLTWLSIEELIFVTSVDHMAAT